MKAAVRSDNRTAGCIEVITNFKPFGSGVLDQTFSDGLLPFFLPGCSIHYHITTHRSFSLVPVDFGPGLNEALVSGSNVTYQKGLKDPKRSNTSLSL